MGKVLLIPILFGVACLFAGAFGSFHNQISYTVSPEYFTEFKFHQFRISDALPERVGAAVVGWHASWWMGPLIGVVLIPLGLVIPGSANYFWSMFHVFTVVLITTLLTGLTALLIAFLVVGPVPGAEMVTYGNVIDDPVAFRRAGTMHNFSYLGGVLGMISGGVAIFRFRQKFLNPGGIANPKEPNSQLKR